MNSRTIAASLALLTLLPLSAPAKGRQPPSPTKTSIEKRNERLMQLINVNIILTDDQRKAIASALDNQNKREGELQRQYDAEEKKLSEDTDRLINSVLNDEQRVTYDRAKEALKNEEAKKMRQRERQELSAGHPESEGRTEGREHQGRRGDAPFVRD